MASYFDLIKVAKTLGLQGHDLEEYISNELERQQSDKSAAAEAEIRKKEAEKEQIEAEIRKLEIAKEASEAANLASESEEQKLKAGTERLLAVKEVTEMELENQLAILTKQAELDKEEKKRAFVLCIHAVNEETKRQATTYQFEVKQTGRV